MSRNVITIDGEEFILDDDDCLISENPSEDRRRSATLVDMWGRRMADAKRFFKLEDAAYRQWRAQIFAGGNNGAPYSSEAKAKAAIESMSEFIAMKERVAKAEHAADVCLARYQAFLRYGADAKSAAEDDRFQQRVAGPIGREDEEGGDEDEETRLEQGVARHYRK